MTINLSIPATHQLKPRITVVGVGGAGGNAVNNMITSHLEGVEFVVANTDAQALAQSLSERRIQLGVTITQGLGAGSRPDVGRAATEEAIDEIIEHIQDCNMVFITAGMGGGTGSGGGPVVARVAREQGVLTVAVVTKPFQFEGVHRMRIAEEGIHELQQYVDTLIIIPNQNLFRVANEKTTFADAFKMADDVLSSGVRGVTDLMVMPGLINLDFADVRAVMAEMGKAMMGTGEAEGERRAVDAAESAISNPLLDDVSMRGAKGVLINITGGYDMTLFEVDESANRIREEVDPDANIIFGSTFDESLAGKMRVSVVATGIETEDEKQGDLTVAVAEPYMQRKAAEAAYTTQVQSDLRPSFASAGDRLAPEAEDEQPAVEPAAAESASEDEPAVAAAEEAAGEDAAGEDAAGEGVRGDDFIPPPAIEPGGDAPRPAEAEPFAAAAMANGPQPTAERRRGPTLFERVTGSGRARQLRPKRERAADALAEAPTPVAADRLVPPRVEEDLLDIPAFLRRQAN
jgi:cell division protein FtsZ